MTRSVESKRVRPVRLNARWGYSILAALLWVLPLIPEVRVWLVGLDGDAYRITGLVYGLVWALTLVGIFKGDRK